MDEKYILEAITETTRYSHWNVDYQGEPIVTTKTELSYERLAAFLAKHLPSCNHKQAPWEAGSKMQ